MKSNEGEMRHFFVFALASVVLMTGCKRQDAATGQSTPPSTGNAAPPAITADEIRNVANAVAKYLEEDDRKGEPKLRADGWTPEETVKVISVDLQNSNSALHPLVGVFSIKRTQHSKRTTTGYDEFIFVDTFTATVAIENGEWTALKGERHIDVADSFVNGVQQRGKEGQTNDCTELVRLAVATAPKPTK